MNVKKLIIGAVVVLFILFLGLVGLLALMFLGDVDISPIQETSPPVFTVIEVNTAADSGYAIFNYRGEGNITMLALDKMPKKEIIVINDSRAIQADKLPDLVEDLRTLEKYGYELTVAEEATIADAIYVIPSGALPSYALFNLQQGSSKGTILYVGDTDLILSRGIKRQPWYDSLSEEQQERVVHYQGPLDDFIKSENYSLVSDILYETWNQQSNTTMNVTDDGADTIVTKLDGSQYVRLVYELDDELYGVSDTGPLQFTPQYLTPIPLKVFPWERAKLDFDLNKTNGTAEMEIQKEGKTIEKQFLRRVTDDNVFIKSMQYNEPGKYIIHVTDNTRRVASGILHVKDLDIELADRRGVTFQFDVTVDGEPLDNTDVMVGLGDSEKSKFYVSAGQLTVQAKPDPGENIFNIEIFGTTVPYRYNNDQKGFFDFYLTYGLPGIGLVLVIYFGARLSRKPMYSVRFGESATYIRQEIRLPLGRALDSFKRIRSDMKLGKSPITPHEFAISLKRYLTNGADVTEGNVEEILKKLVGSGKLEAHRDYYQLKGEGDVRRNTLRRMAREKLIESGTQFNDSDGKFVTKDFEIGFFGQNFKKKGIVVVDDNSEVEKILQSLTESERSRIEILRANDMLRFVPIGKLEDVL
jgi:hypothetical protein